GGGCCFCAGGSRFTCCSGRRGCGCRWRTGPAFSPRGCSRCISLGYIYGAKRDQFPVVVTVSHLDRFSQRHVLPHVTRRHEMADALVEVRRGLEVQLLAAV